MSHEKWIRASNVLTGLALIAVAGSFLALTDIYHGEADVHLEWNMVRVALPVIVVAQVVTLATLRRLQRSTTAR